VKVARLGLAVIGAIVALSMSTSPAEVLARECASSSTAAGLDDFFGADDAAGIAGADYPHAIDLPDGRTLWYFQDVFFGSGDRLDGNRFAHNAALVQDGDCFEPLPPPGGSGSSWIGSWVETDLNNWIWPLDAEVDADGTLSLFLSEVQNPNGSGAARGALPVGTWIAKYSLPELRLLGMAPAPDASRSLFGYSIVSDPEYSYLYGHCYRQFDSAGLIGFNPDCSPYAYVARVPLGEFDQELEYWTDDGWSDDRDGRVPVLAAESSMPVSVQRFGDVYVAASDENDWFGPDVVVYTAPAPQGPWTEATRYTPPLRCERCNNYGAFVMPNLEGDQVVVALSNNAWNMTNAFSDASIYRIDVEAVDVPGVSTANLQREPDLELARAEPNASDGDDDESATADEDDDESASSSVVPAVVAVVEDPALALFDSIDLVGGDEPAATRAIRIGATAALVLLVVFAVAVAGLTISTSSVRSRGRRFAVLGRISQSGPGRDHGRSHGGHPGEDHDHVISNSSITEHISRSDS
jgi:hypothetical protein